MEEYATFTARAGLVVLGLHVQQLKLWEIVAEQVHIRQRIHRHTPLEKLLDCFINILAGGHGLVEINTRVRPDVAVQRAFGRRCCADQSTISDTLSRCRPENVQELRRAIEEIIRQQGQSYAHDYTTHWQLFDLDMLGLPAGRLSEGSTKGYFAGRHNTRGRQVGRVVATAYEEVLVDRLYEGTRQLEASLPELVDLTEQALHLSKPQQNQAILRVDGGGGTDADINQVLDRGYFLLVKVHNWRRALKLAKSVPAWFPDPRAAERQVGWVGRPKQYSAPTRQVAVRILKPNGKWLHHVIVSNCSDEMLFELARVPRLEAPTPEQVALTLLYAYDQRGGGIETQNRNDKQGLGLSHRNKHGFAAQEMLVLLAQLAHDVLIWLRNDLAHIDPRFAKFGILRLVRDVLAIPGCIRLTPQGRVTAISLNADHPLAPALLALCKKYFKDDELSVYLGQN